MLNKRLLFECRIEDGDTLRVGLRSVLQLSREGGIEPLQYSEWPPHLKQMLNQAMAGLAEGKAPRLAMDGEGGTYFLSGSQSTGYVACFKPQDEEPFAPCNPKNFQGTLGQVRILARLYLCIIPLG